MQIDERVERRLRNAYSRILAKDGEGMVAALEGLGPEESVTAVGMALFVVGYVVNATFPDGATDEQLHTVAQDIVNDESDWVDLGDVDTLARFLSATRTADPWLRELGLEEGTGLALVCGGHLLGHYYGDDQEWYEFLDEIWAAFEAQD
jgi:hypothetical protein